MIWTVLQVAIGGAFGAVARFGAGHLALRVAGGGFPWGTLAVNVIGSFLMGVLVIVLAQKDATRLAPFLMTGILGGFTTFSAFSLDTVALIERDQTQMALFYVVGSVVLSLGAILLAMSLTRGMFQ